MELEIRPMKSPMAVTIMVRIQKITSVTKMWLKVGDASG
jgi:hypothetical protein